MEKHWGKTLSSLILTFALVLPMVVGLTHALHEHAQVVCLAENESHIHNEGVDCDHEHYFNPKGVVERVALDEKHIPGANTIASWRVPSATYNNLSSYQHLRGPPVINV